jgi:hypothetical protein
MSSSDVFAVRKNATGFVADGTPARLRQVEVFTSSTGTPRLTFTDGSGGATLLDLDFTTSDTHSVNIPADGIRFKDGVYLSAFTDIVAVTVFLA